MRHKSLRLAWILEYMRVRSTADLMYRVDVLDSCLVEAYIDYAGCRFVPVLLGADRCPQLGRDLKCLFDDGKLERYRVGINGMGWGWPKWVWSYGCAVTK